MKKVRGEGFTVRFIGRANADRKERAPTEKMQDPIPSPEPVSAPRRPEPVSATPAQPQTAKPDLQIKLWDAARNGDCAAIRFLVMDGVDLDARDEEGRTAINIATQYNQQGAMKTLLAAREMKRMAAQGHLPDTNFFRKFKAKTGNNKA